MRIRPTSQITVIVACLISACAYEAPIKRQTPAVFLETRVPGAKGSVSKILKKTQSFPGLFAKTVTYPQQINTFKITLGKLKNKLVGLDTNELTALLGEPKFVRVEFPGRIWQFQSTICFIDLFLYKKEGEFVATHVEARSNKVKKIDSAACFSSILDTQKP